MARTGQDLVDELRADLDEHVAGNGNWQDAHLLLWINKGIVRVVADMRAQRERWFDTIMLSTDSASTILGETYTPSTALKPTSGNTTITLPPNCIEVVKILPLSQTDLDNGLQFVQKDLTSIEFIAAQRHASNVNTRTYYFDSYGTRTLKIAPVLATSFDIALHYVAMPEAITLSTTLTTVPDWMLDAAVLYAHYRALMAIKHDDYQSALTIYAAELRNLIELNRPRESQDVQVIEGVFDSDDTTYGYDSL